MEQRLCDLNHMTGGVAVIQSSRQASSFVVRVTLLGPCRRT